MKRCRTEDDLGSILGILVALALGWVLATGAHQKASHLWLERAVNKKTESVFGGTVRFDRVHGVYVGMSFDFQPES